MLRRLGESRQQLRNRVKHQIRIAPAESGERRKPLALDRAQDVGRHIRRLPGDPESSGPPVAPGPARDLPDLLHLQGPARAAVKFRQPGKGHVVDVEIEPHADGIRGHEQIHLAVLEQGDLGIARARAERTEHHRRPAPPVPHALGELVHRTGREGDEGRTGRQAVKPRAAGIRERGKPLPPDKIGIGDQIPDPGPGTRRAQKQRLDPPPRMQQPVGEDMPPLRIGAELDLVHRDKIHLPLRRHRLHGADKIPAPPRGGIFSSPVTSATASAPHRARTRS